MARRRKNEPDISGVLVVDKPAGMTSHDVVGVVRRSLGMRRVGHTGTLDPAATGVLILAVGRATRLVNVLQGGPKTYAATMVLGIETDSQDADGAVVAETDASHLTEQQICEALTLMQGDIQQIPPMVSAIKIDGERLHEKARRGEVVEREPRDVTIHDLVLEDCELGEHPVVSFLVTCSPGTYVRTIAHDVGAHLGVGGSLTALRRIANGGFAVEEAISLDEVKELAEGHALRERLLAPAVAMRSVPQHVVDADTARGLAHGRSLDVAAAGDGPLAVMYDDTLIGLYEVTDGVAAPDVVLVRPEDELVASA